MEAWKMAYFRLIYPMLDHYMTTPLEDASLSIHYDTFGAKIHMDVTPSMKVQVGSGASDSVVTKQFQKMNVVVGTIGQICVELDGELYVWKEWNFESTRMV